MRKSVRHLCLVSVALFLFGCEKKESDSTSGAAAPPRAAAIAFLLPEAKTTRYESFDRPLFEAEVKRLCADCAVLYFNADQDAAKQQSQIEAALTQGAKVLVLDAVDAAAVGAMVARAGQKGIAVVAYDRLITGVAYDAYVSFDNVKIGQTQGDALLKALEANGTTKGKIVMINGSPTDPSAKDYKKGAHLALDGKVAVGMEFDTPDWSPNKAAEEMEQAIVALGKDQIVGVYAANDGTAGGAIAAIKRAGFTDPPPVTGQDAELTAVQRILSGDQYMTVYLDIRSQAEQAAALAVGLARGESVKPPATVNNGGAEIPAWLLQPIPVTKDRIKDTILKDRFYTVDQICVGEAAAACDQEKLR